MNVVFTDKVVLVTGASSGIGRAAALAFARAGAKTVACARREDKGQETAALIRQEGGAAEFIRCDVSKAGDVRHLISEIERLYGRLDVAFNNAGLFVSSSVMDLEEDDWDRVIDTNLKGIWLCMKYEIPLMLAGGGGAIVNNSSINGLVGVGGFAAYAASKFGVVGLTKAAAWSVGKDGIRVNAICPGLVPTALSASLTGDTSNEETDISKGPIGRFGTLDEIADAVLFLSSDKASFLNGQAIAVDGGNFIK